MANYNKSFSFRNGVQVDDSNFVVNSQGLVGIGTSVPSQSLDVRGTASISGLVTAKDLFSTGIATFSTIRVGSGVSISNSGVITATKFYGDGSALVNIPTSQWVDTDVGLGFTSIYAQGYVGISTLDPRSSLQVGANPNSGGNGVGINSNGNIVASGIITATKFVGSGVGITAIDAANIYSGTLDNARLPIIDNAKLPSNINISGILTAATGNFTSISAVSIAGTISGNLIGNVIGNVTGNLTGTATTAQGLTGTPNIVVGVVTATSLQSSSSLSVGTAGTALNVTTQGNIGIGTSIPLSDFQILKKGALAEIISSSGQSRLSIGQVTGIGKSTAVLRFGNESNSFDIINNDIGNINSYLHAGPSGVGTGRFAWIYGQSNAELASLTYDGKFGIGVTNPTNTLHVVGTSTVTGASYVGGNIEIVGSLSLGTNSNRSIINPTTNSVLNKVNLNVTAGVSTLANIFVGAGSSIGFGNSPIVDIDARNKVELIGQIGVATNTSSFTPSLFVNGKSSFIEKVGIGTANPLAQINDPQLGSLDSGLLQVFGQLNVYDQDIIVRGVGGIGIGSDLPKTSLDMSRANYANGIRGAFIPPVMTTAERDALYPNYLWPGMIIYNTTVNKHQGLNNSAWNDLY
jgi:hypothetical protein